MAPQASTPPPLAAGNRQLDHRQNSYNSYVDYSDKSQMPILAQAKPAIISPPEACNDFDPATGILREKIKSALKLSPSSRETVRFKFDGRQTLRHIEDESIIQKQNASNQMRQAAVTTAAAGQQRVRLSATERLALTAKRPTPSQQIQTKTTLGGGLQQQVAPMPNQQKPPQVEQNLHQRTAITSTSSLCSIKSAPLPTLETLLAVQRQLQQHTKQNLNSMPQPPVINNNNSNDRSKDQEQRGHQEKSFYNPTTNGFTTRAESRISNQDSVDSVNMNNIRTRKPLPPSPPKSPLPVYQGHLAPSTNVTVETYDKDLPPLPSSISPSTTTDESQMNSLDSQSSPATSLVSLPPPPPPISSYLEQYDEVNSACHHQSTSSITSTVSSMSEASSVRQFIPLQVKPHHHVTKPSDISDPKFEKSNHKFQVEDQAPKQEQRLQQQNLETKPDRPPIIGPKPSSLRLTYMASKLAAAQSLNKKPEETQQDCNRGLLQRQILQQAHQQAASQNNGQSSIFQALQNASQFDPIAQESQATGANMLRSSSQVNSALERPASYQAPINYQQHMFKLPATMQDSTNDNLQSPQLSDGQFEPVPLPPTPMKTNMSPVIGNSIGLNQLDSGTFRFPTPPPPDLLLDGSDDNDEDVGRNNEPSKPSEYPFLADDDEGYLCKIPTPPPYQSISVASFNGVVDVQHGQQASQLQATPQMTHTYNPAIGHVVHQQKQQDNCLQPPALFRQQQQQFSASSDQMIGPPPPTGSSAAPNPLTVHIGNDRGGLLSTAGHPHHHHALASRLMAGSQALDCVDGAKEANNHGTNNYNRHHHLIMSSSSPSSSSDGDGQSSNSSSSTSGIHSSIDSPSSSSSKLYDFNYSLGKKLNTTDSARRISSLPASGVITSQGNVCRAQAKEQPQVIATNKSATVAMRPALKQKKSVSFSDKVELVACADEHTEDHLPNPLLARVLAGKSQ